MPRLQFARLKTILPIVSVPTSNGFEQGLRRFAPECGMNVRSSDAVVGITPIRDVLDP
jgi:hypothetical protein